MADLQANHPKLVVEELQVYKLCKKRADGAGPSTNPGSGADGSGDDGVDWAALEAEED